MKFNDREEIIALTPLWKENGCLTDVRKVADKYLDALYGMTLEKYGNPSSVLGYEISSSAADWPLCRLFTTTEENW